MKTYFFKLEGETPSKKNSRVTNRKTGRTFPNKKYIQWHAAALAQLIRQKQTNGLTEPINTPCRLSLYFTHGDKRRRDADNGTSSICDTLTDSGIIEDDNYNIISETHIFNRYIKNEPSCVIVLEQIETVANFDNLFNAVNDFI